MRARPFARATFAVASAAIVSCLLSSCSSDERTASARQSIEGGVAAPGQPAIVAIVPRRLRCEEGFAAPECTGVVIGERAVLTAAHCLEIDPRGTAEVFVGDVVGAAGTSRRIVGRVLHPQYDRASSEFDLGIAWLDAKLDVAPVPLPTIALDASWVGKTARVVGFGGGDARREGTVKLSGVEAGTVTYEPGPQMTCRGDSGGPVFVANGAGEALVALTSSGDLDCKLRGIGPRLDVLAATFVAPALAAGPPAAVDPSIDALCQRACEVDADCPGDFLCLTNEDGSSRCRMLDRPSVTFGAACTGDGECGGGRCARLGNECRCEVSCATPPSAPPPPPPEGCTVARAPGSARPAIVWAWVSVLIVASRRARRAR